MSARSGRAGTSDPEYRRNRAALLAYDNLCWLCHHPGAKTADHIISAKDWPKDRFGKPMPGFNALTNLAPAHGTMGNKTSGTLNRCPTCRRLCNQSRGARPVRSPRSRKW